VGANTDEPGCGGRKILPRRASIAGTLNGPGLEKPLIYWVFVMARRLLIKRVEGWPRDAAIVGV
jgi:hypothetical protein